MMRGRRFENARVSTSGHEWVMRFANATLLSVGAWSMCQLLPPSMLVRTYEDRAVGSMTDGHSPSLLPRVGDLPPGR